MATDFKLGAYANKVTPSFGDAQQRIARYQFGADTATAAAGQITNQDGIGGVVKAALTGMAIGQGGKAKIETAIAQDEYNKYIQSLTDYQVKLQRASEMTKASNDAIEQLSVPVASARIKFAQDGDKEAWNTQLQRTGQLYAQKTGMQLQSVVPSDNPDLFTVTMTDPIDGHTDTQVLSTDLFQQATSKLDAGIGNAFMEARGIDISKLQKDPTKMSPEQKLQKLNEMRTQIQSSGGNPDDAYSALGMTKTKSEPTGEQQDLNDLYKGNIKDITTLGAQLRQAPQRAFAADNAVKAFGEALAKGQRTGASAAEVNSLKSTINTVTGSNIFDTAPLDKLGAATLPLVLDVAKNLKPLSDSDRKFAEQQVAGVANSPAANVVLMSIVKAAAMRDADNFNTYKSGGKKGMVDAWTADGTTPIEPYYQKAYQEVLTQLKQVHAKTKGAAPQAGSSTMKTYNRATGQIE